MVAYWTRIWRVRRSQRWGWQRMRETMFEGLGTQPISLVKMWSWECERSSILHKWKPPHRIIVTMTLFTNSPAAFYDFLSLLHSCLVLDVRCKLETLCQQGCILHLHRGMNYQCLRNHHLLRPSWADGAEIISDIYLYRLRLWWTLDSSILLFTKRAYQKGVVLVQCPGW